MKKVLLTATVQSHICQFHKPLVAMLHENGYEVHVAARDNLAEKNGLALDFVDQVYDVPFARSPKSPDNLKAYLQLKKIINEGDYDVVHCNTPMGGIVSRLAAMKARKHGTKVVYTAHGFHFYEGSPKKNWFIFYPIEKFMSRFCDVIVTITEEDYRLASKKFHCKTEHIHGVGVYSDRYHPVDYNTAMEMRRRENLSAEDFVILCVGELNQNKNQKTLISAAYMLRKHIPELKILLAGNGPLEEDLRTQIDKLERNDAVRLLGYRTDLETITPAVDLVVSCSHREGLPLNIIEAMLCRKPVVASINRGHKELVMDKVTGFLVEADDKRELAKKILVLYKKSNLRKTVGDAGYEKVLDYTADNVSKELESIYNNLK